jgi:hypothetical protein
MSTAQQEHGKIEQLQQANADELEVMAGRERENLEGWVPELANEVEVREALEKAFDYRGDVTITRKDGSVVEGYLYDRRSGRTLVDSVVRIIPAPKPGAPTERVMVAYADIAGLKFSGRDTAAGRSFDAWVKKYWEKKAAGETNIGIEAETLD